MPKEGFKIKQTIRPEGKYRKRSTKTKIEFPKAKEAADKQADANRNINDRKNFKARQASGSGKGDATRPTNKKTYNKNYDEIDWGKNSKTKTDKLQVEKGQKTIIQYGNSSGKLGKYSGKNKKIERWKTSAKANKLGGRGITRIVKE